MPRNGSHSNGLSLFDRTLVLALTMLLIVAQLTAFAVRAHAAGPAGIGEPATPSLCERATGAHLEALLLKHRPHLLLGGPITRPARQAR